VLALLTFFITASYFMMCGFGMLVGFATMNYLFGDNGAVAFAAQHAYYLFEVAAVSYAGLHGDWYSHYYTYSYTGLAGRHSWRYMGLALRYYVSVAEKECEACISHDFTDVYAVKAGFV